MSLREEPGVVPRTRADTATTAKTLDLHARIRTHLATAAAGMKRAEEALRTAAAEIKQEQVADLEHGLLISFAATAEANGCMLEKMGARVAWLLSPEQSRHGPGGAE